MHALRGYKETFLRRSPDDSLAAATGPSGQFQAHSPADAQDGTRGHLSEEDV